MSKESLPKDIGNRVNSAILSTYAKTSQVHPVRLLTSREENESAYVAQCSQEAVSSDPSEGHVGRERVEVALISWERK